MQANRHSGAAVLLPAKIQLVQLHQLDDLVLDLLHADERIELGENLFEVERRLVDGLRVRLLAGCR